MLTADELLAMRSTSDSALSDTGTITRDGESSFDSGTGLITPGTPTTIYSGAMRVRQPTAAESEVLFGERQVTRSKYIVTVPYDTTDVRVEDVVTVTVSDDSDLVNRPMRVVAVPTGTWMISKRFPVEDVE